MAVTTTGWFSNSIPGNVNIAADFDIFQKDVLPRVAVGTRITRQDGAEFAYCHFGEDTNVGLLVAADASESSENALANQVISPASANNTNDGTIGSKFVEINLDAATSDSSADRTTNDYAGGYLTITSGTGLGYTYRIKGNTASDVPADQNIRMELYEPLQLAVDNTSDIVIVGSPFANVETADAAADVVISGVSLSNMDVSVASFGWIQTKGIANISVDAADVTLGDIVALSADAPGEIYTIGDSITDAISYDEEEIVGVALATTADGAFCPTKLKLW